VIAAGQIGLVIAVYIVTRNTGILVAEIAPPELFKSELAGEINRATPRTQSALLEAMQERQVTVDGETKLLPRPFLVLATQNPIELEGTFPLPEAQLDRFLLRVRLGYPGESEEMTILERFRAKDPLRDLDELGVVHGCLDRLWLRLAPVGQIHHHWRLVLPELIQEIVIPGFVIYGGKYACVRVALQPRVVYIKLEGSVWQRRF
jgi:hypothetical protein